MSVNSFGRLFRFSTWGESHGPAIGAVVDGCPPGLHLSEADVQPFLDKRRPGTSRFTTQRQEPDQVRILSGVFEGRTTGTPISLMIDNVDQRSKDYSDIATGYRPGHADFAYDAKYGHRDWRGGGRSSARETASRVAAGAVARLVLPEVTIRAYVVEIGGDAIDRANFDADQIDANPFFCPDAAAAVRWEALVDEARKAGSSVGAVIECVASGCRQAGARPSTPSSTPNWRRPACRSTRSRGSRSATGSPRSPRHRARRGQSRRRQARPDRPGSKPRARPAVPPLPPQIGRAHV